ncbi:AraC family transcriptional regulator [Photobacterium kishitanii]|uniref:AraC family transcriptional regulator n=2 Tax=Photobacterium kishitanii TaxID=318456 RepID=A0A2T3KKD5_9GAMM|nr:AraC family transcriptional regulator [Photobacterium kishitanii]PSU99974.1 AraC family transcriptional regulator [Photobacterium kishitanii]PSV09324.1 AraC family transcriptional regulator [Photobacterium kishitanii]
MKKNLKSPADFLTSSKVTKQIIRYSSPHNESLTIWRNEGRDVSYYDLLGHTFSYYINCGLGSKRKQNPDNLASPGKFCVFPEGSSSDWVHSSPLVFMHLHVSDSEIRRRYVEMFDYDARCCHIPEITFGDFPEIQNIFKQLYASLYSHDSFFIECAISEVISRFLLRTPPHLKHKKMRGGLSSYLSKNLREYIEQNLDNKITLSTLSSKANLSEFHFQRVFQQSFGVSPAKWILESRITKAKELLRKNTDLKDISSQCGFSDQSHMTRQFKKMTGLTPNEYRQVTDKRSIIVPVSRFRHGKPD